MMNVEELLDKADNLNLIWWFNIFYEPEGIRVVGLNIAEEKIYPEDEYIMEEHFHKTLGPALEKMIEWDEELTILNEESV